MPVMHGEPTSNERKLELLEKALASLRQYQKGLPVQKRKGETGVKVAAMVAKLELLAERVARRG